MGRGQAAFYIVRLLVRVRYRPAQGRRRRRPCKRRGSDLWTFRIYACRFHPLVLYAGLYFAGLQMHPAEQAVCNKGFFPCFHDYDLYDHFQAVCPSAFIGADVHLYAL